MIDFEAPTPLYRQIAADIERRIDQGEITKRLPSSTRLAEEYRVSQRTIVESLRLLRESGRIIGVKGRGTFVREP